MRRRRSPERSTAASGPSAGVRRGLVALGEVRQESDRFRCSHLRAELSARVCILRQRTREKGGRFFFLGCALCPDGQALTARVEKRRRLPVLPPQAIEEG